MLIESTIAYGLLYLLLLLWGKRWGKEVIRILAVVPAVYFFVDAELYRTLTPIGVAVGLSVGYLCYILSGLIVDAGIRKHSFLPVIPRNLVPGLRKVYYKRLLRNAFSCTMEELTYRGLLFHFFLHISDSRLIAVAAVTVWFAGVHYLVKKATVQKIDLFVFSLIITAAYAIHSDIYMVILIHILRNMLIIMQNTNDENLRLQKMYAMAAKMKKVRK